MKTTMTLAFAGMFTAFILTSPLIPEWALIFPAALTTSELILQARRDQR